MKVLVTTSTFPVSDKDEAPAFVKEQVVQLKQQFPSDEYIVHAPHNAYTTSLDAPKTQADFTELRYHYFWPFKWELLTGRGIMPALKQNKLLYGQIPFFIIFHFISLLRTTRKQKPDLLYAHWFMPQAINAALVSKLTKTPLLFTTHASDVSVITKFPLANRIIKRVCTQSSAYTAVSQRTHDKLQTAFTPEEWRSTYQQKMTILPMGVTTSTVQSTKKEITALRTKHDIPASKQYIVFIGRLAEKKGVTYLIDALALLDTSSPGHALHCIIAGDGQERAALEQQAKNAGVTNITFTGYVHQAEKNTLLTLADYVCLPSIIDSKGDSEGLPVVLMEALAAGKIILASDVSGGETILHDTTDGFVFNQKSADSLHDTLLKALNLNAGKRAAIEKHALSLSKQFEWSRIAKKHHDLFIRIVNADSTE